MASGGIYPPMYRLCTPAYVRVLALEFHTSPVNHAGRGRPRIPRSGPSQSLYAGAVGRVRKSPLISALKEMMKRDLICFAVAAVAIPLALSVINVQAQEADDLPRLGETAAEYEARILRTQAERAAQREEQERFEAAIKRSEKAVKDSDRTITDEKARAERAHRNQCDRWRGAYSWSASAAELYATHCTD